ncbi:MAG: glycine--tRNA ligase [Cytophagales bacterium]|nr:glycine--tRNA ligase [Cytophagales bacterium]MDW8383788.1 glycine--tRNA ligase [Flammeovirgaceae bacterium]
MSADKNHENLFQTIVAHAKEYGFVFPSSEIYDGLAAVYDYGSNGVELKNNLKQFWWSSMTQLHDNIVGIDAAIFMHPTVWKASGHVDGFNDPMIDNKDSKKRYRVDHLIEEKASQYQKENKPQEAQRLLDTFNELLKKEDLESIRNLILEEKIVCPVSGTANWTEVRQFNLMFSTQIGSVAEEANTIYLRPETAQGIFVNFLNVQKSARMKIPFGIAQIGKAFRNEIVARQFTFRMREFEQMEMQFFIRPGTELEWYEKWKEIRLRWHRALGIPAEKLKFHVHEKLAHYANAACDIEYAFPFGSKEVEGIHSRTDYDLSRHEQYSKKKIKYFDEEIKQSYTPYVIETSIGADRCFLMLLCEAYTTDKGIDAEGNEKERIYLKLIPALAPIKVAVFPLVKKDGLPDKAIKLYNDLKFEMRAIYEEGAAIGKRYTRQDLIGTPYCVTIDHQTLEDDTVTIRLRDDASQFRLPIDKVKDWLLERVSLQALLKKLA